MDKKEVEKELAENVRMGDAEIIGEADDGEPIFRITKQGIAKVEQMLKENPKLLVDEGLVTEH